MYNKILNENNPCTLETEKYIDEKEVVLRFALLAVAVLPFFLQCGGRKGNERR